MKFWLSIFNERLSYMDGLTILLILTLLLLICVMSLLSTAFIVFITYNLGIIQAKKQGIEKQIIEKQETLQTQKNKIQQLSVDIRQYEHNIIIMKKETQSLENKKAEIENRILGYQQNHSEQGNNQKELTIAVEKSVQEIGSEQKEFGENIQDVSTLSEQIETSQYEFVTSHGQLNDQKVERLKSDLVQMIEQERNVPLLCKRCGKSLLFDVRFCHQCGTEVD